MTGIPEGSAVEGSAARTSSTESRIARWIGWTLVGIAIWLAHVRWPMPTAPAELDPSWQQALQYALVHGMRFGPDIVFTFGPLGGLEYARYQPELYWTQILLYELLFKGLIAWRWVVALRRWKAPGAWFAFLALLVTPAVNDSYYISTLVILGADMLHDERVPRRRLILDLFLVAAISYIKFTFLVLGLAVCGLAGVRAMLRARSEGLAGRALAHRALAVLGLGVAVFVVVWMACGQRPWDLPIWFSRCATIAGGYAESQAEDGDLADVHTALAGLFVLAATLVAFVFHAPGRTKAVLIALVVAGGAYVSFRGSFTCHGQRGFMFYATLGLCACSLLSDPLARPGRRIALAVGRAMVVVMAVAGTTGRFQDSVSWLMLGQGAGRIEESLRSGLQLPELRERLEKERVELEQRFALPRIRAMVGSATIDYLGNSQSWLFLNHLNWKPRPIFQAYVATTAELGAINGAFYESDEAPEFVLYQGDSLGARMAWLDDAASRFAVLKGYSPVAIERGLLLLRRDPEGRRRTSARCETIAEFEAGPENVHSLAEYAGQVLVVRVEVRYSLLGRLRHLFYHAPLTWVSLHLNDGSVRHHRFIPGMGRGGMLLRPCLEFEEDWIDVFTRGPIREYTSLRMRSSTGWPTFYKPTYHVSIDRWEGVLPEPSPELLIDLVFGSFPTRPRRWVSAAPPRYYQIDGREVALVYPEAKLVFDVQAGPRRMRGAFGLFPPTIEQSDGVDFRVALLSRDGVTRVLLERTLDKGAADAARASMDIEFVAKEGDRVVVSTVNPVGRGTDWDVPFVEAIHIE